MTDLAIQVGKTLTEKVVTEGQKNPAASGDSAFSKLLTERLDQQGGMNKEIMASFGLTPEKEMQAISAEGLEIKASEISAHQEIRTHHKALELLTDVNRGALQMDSMIELATSGKRFTPAELLALQAGVHQIALSIDLTGKILEQVNTGTKTLLQTNFA